ncbi:sensor histidine kinase [Kitasatospora sp. NPDC006697]|uniref:sensor histidine kinase n=1 Tax=Kitasatospora sp. NPDC006697 TaxID=3364020 RepID=UPI0036C65DA6
MHTEPEVTEEAPSGWRRLLGEVLRRDRTGRRPAWPRPRVLVAESLATLVLTGAAVYQGTVASLGSGSMDSVPPIPPPPGAAPGGPICYPVPPDGGTPIPLEGRDFVLLLLTTLPLLARRRYPLTVYWLVLIAALSAQGYSSWPTLVGLAAAAWSAIRYSATPRSVFGSLLLGGVLALSGLGSSDGGNLDATRPLVLVNVVGLLVASFQFYRQGVRDHAQRLADLERDQAEATAKALEEERARIAAELHDVVTHNVSMMVIQAGAGRRVLDSGDPEQAREALLAVESAGRAAMAELRHVMGLLAVSGGVEAVDELEPQPGLDQLEQLVARVRAAGLPVELALALPEEPLPSGVDLTAYRVVQEALTNAIKHAVGATATVSVAPEGDFLRIEVANTAGRPGPQAGTGGGRGLLGMRERLALYGGELDAGRRIGGGYQVKARLRWRAVG